MTARAGRTLHCALIFTLVVATLASPVAAQEVGIPGAPPIDVPTPPSDPGADPGPEPEPDPEPPDAPDTPTEGDEEDEAGNETDSLENETALEEAESPLSGVPLLPSPESNETALGWALVEGALVGFVEDLGDGVAGLIDTFNRSLLTLPAPGEPGDGGSWEPPSDPFWEASFTVYWSLVVLILPLVWIVGWLNVGLPRGRSRRERFRTLLIALVGLLAGWVILAAWFHLWNTAALNFAPSGDELLATPGDVTKFGVGVVVGVALLATKATVVLIGLAVHLAFVMLTYVLVALWPLFVGLYALDLWPVSPLGTAGIAATLILAPIQFIKALVLRLVYEFPLEVTEPETAATFLLIVVGVLLAFVLIPYYGLKYLTPQAIVASGGQLSTADAAERMHRYRDRVPSGEQIRSRMGRDEWSEPDSSLSQRRETRSRRDDLPDWGDNGGWFSGRDTRSRTNTRSGDD
jgi:hypothetical protein